MGIIASIGNIYFVYQFLKKLVTPFEKTKPFEMGIIDKDGKILKRRRDLETKEEKADKFNAAPYSTGKVAASFTSTAMNRETVHEAAIIEEDVVRYARVKKKGK